MRNVILLDIDGVLIITPSWKPDAINNDGYSDFDTIAVDNFNQLLNTVTAELWLTSSRRTNNTLLQFNQIFKNRKISKELNGFIPQGTKRVSRLIEINRFLDHEPVRNFLIIDDDNSLEDLDTKRKQYWIKTLPLLGFNNAALLDAHLKIASWNSGGL